MENLIFDLRYYPSRFINVSKAKFGLWFANMLPKYLVTWCGIRIASVDDGHNKNIMDAIGSFNE